MDNSQKPKEPARTGRPSVYTDDLATLICEELAMGGALHKLCETMENWPTERTVYRWLESNDAFRQMYARARERQMDREVDEMKTIADNATDANLARVQVDVRKWRASKLAMKKYGDKVVTELTGANGGPLQVEPVNPLEIIEARLARLIAARTAD
jgi:hypothetical protein